MFFSGHEISRYYYMHNYSHTACSCTKLPHVFAVYGILISLQKQTYSRTACRYSKLAYVFPVYGTLIALYKKFYSHTDCNNAKVVDILPGHALSTASFVLIYSQTSYTQFTCVLLVYDILAASYKNMYGHTACIYIQLPHVLTLYDF